MINEQICIEQNTDKIRAYNIHKKIYGHFDKKIVDNINICEIIHEYYSPEKPLDKQYRELNPDDPRDLYHINFGMNFLIFILKTNKN